MYASILPLKPRHLLSQTNDGQFSHNRFMPRLNFIYAANGPPHRKLRKNETKITEPAQISLVFYFINKLDLNIPLNITRNNVHKEFVLRGKVMYDKCQLHHATCFWNLLKYYVD